MDEIPVLDDLFRFNAWGNARLLEMAAGLTDAQLDEPRDLGPGSLRNVIYHTLGAEELWLQRWQGNVRPDFQFHPNGITLDVLAARQQAVNRGRRELLKGRGPEGLQEVCHYHDMKGNPWSNRLEDLVLHVANHGIHHRAQALHFLKQFGRTTPIGLDYIVYRCLHPSVPQPASGASALQAMGLAAGTSAGPPVAWDHNLMQKWFAYGDWANRRLQPLIADLSPEQLDRDFGMGRGSLRATASHIFEAEQFWVALWVGGESTWQSLPSSTTPADLQARWDALIPRRNEFLAGLDGGSAQRIIPVRIGNADFVLPVVESAIQLCGHGTHHRAQIMNMLRQSGVSPPPMDLVVWARETAPAAPGRRKVP